MAYLLATAPMPVVRLLGHLVLRCLLGIHSSTLYTYQGLVSLWLLCPVFGGTGSGNCRQKRAYFGTAVKRIKDYLGVLGMPILKAMVGMVCVLSRIVMAPDRSRSNAYSSLCINMVLEWGISAAAMYCQLAGFFLSFKCQGAAAPH